MLFIVGNEIPEIGADGKGVLRLRLAQGLLHGSDEARRRSIGEVYFFDGFIRGAPGAGLMMSYRILQIGDEFLKIVLHFYIQAMRQGRNAGVIAVVALDAVIQTLRAVAVKDV